MGDSIAEKTVAGKAVTKAVDDIADMANENVIDKI